MEQYKRTHARTHSHTRMHAHTHTHTHKNIHTLAHTHTQKHIHSCTYAHTVCLLLCIVWSRDGAMQISKEEDSGQNGDDVWSSILTTKLHPNSVTLVPGYWHNKYISINYLFVVT